MDHLKAIKSGEITGTTVRGLRKAITADNRRRDGWSVSQTAPKLGGDELAKVLAEMRRRAPRVVGELHASGLKVLANRRYAKRLASVADMIPAIASFRLVDFWEEGRTATPVYRAETADGRAFDFYNIAWQSGGDGPHVIRVEN